MSKRWLYKVVEVKAHWMGLKQKHFEDTLASLGQQGWELVSAMPNGLGALLYLKKEA